VRLSDYERKMIKKAFNEVFGKGKIYLFGSRVDDSEKGGDIDLFLVPLNTPENVIEKKVGFLIKLDKYIGEQKVDVIISKDKTRLIEQEALKNGVEL